MSSLVKDIETRTTQDLVFRKSLIRATAKELRKRFAGDPRLPGVLAKLRAQTKEINTELVRRGEAGHTTVQLRSANLSGQVPRP